jgi:hypothetical protein
MVARETGASACADVPAGRLALTVHTLGTAAPGSPEVRLHLHALELGDN